MKVRFYLMLSFFASLVLTGQQDILWTKTFGGSVNDFGQCIQITSDSGFIIVGYTFSFGLNQSDVWLLKINPSGDTLWTKTFDFGSYDAGFFVQKTNDLGYIITGMTHSAGTGEDILIVKTDQSGNMVWSKKYGEVSDDCAWCVDKTSDNGYIIAGYSSSSGNRDLWLLKTNGSGDTLWSKKFGGSGSEEGRSVIQCSDKGFIIVGFTNSYGAGNFDLYIIKTDSLGNLKWSKTYGGTGDDMGYSVKKVSGGGYVIVGNTYSYGFGESDIWILRINDTGDTLWTRTFGDMGWDWGYSVFENPDKGFIIAGSTSLTGGTEDVLFIKTDEYGNEKWRREVSGSQVEEVYSVCEDIYGGFVFTGYTYSFGNGEADVYIIKTNPLKVLYPNGGEDLYSGSLCTIEWNFADTTKVSKYRILYSTNGGISYPETIANDIPNNVLTYQWNMPSITSSMVRIKIQALNSSNAVILEDVSDSNFTINDVTGPNLYMSLESQLIRLTDTFKINVNAQDPSGIKSVNIFYRIGGEMSYNKKDYSEKNGDNYVFKIEPSELSIKGLEFYIEAKDSFDNMRIIPDPPKEYFSINVDIEPPGEWKRDIQGNLVPLPNGSTVDKYRIVSFPIVRANDDAMNLFETNLGKYDKKEWRAGYYKGDEDIYIDGVGKGKILPGEAFFVIVKDEGKYLLTGSGMTLKTDTIFRKGLVQGWNMIGNPYPFRIPTSSITLSNSDPVTIYSYKGSWSTVNYLEPWEGYVIHTTSEAYITIDPRMRAKNKTKEEIKKYVRIKAKSGEAVDDYNYIGFMNNADDGYDINDYFEPPMMGEGISLYFPHKDWGRYSGNFTKDIREEGNKRFDFEVKTGFINDVNLTFEVSDIDINKIALVDRDNGIVLRFKDIKEYRYKNNGLNHFSLIIGDEKYIEEEVEKSVNVAEINVDVLTTKDIIIRYSIDYSTYIEISIYDLLGRKIEEVFRGVIKKGSGNFRVENITNPGIYFVRMEFGNKTITKKFMKLR